MRVTKFNKTTVSLDEADIREALNMYIVSKSVSVDTSNRMSWWFEPVLNRVVIEFLN